MSVVQPPPGWHADVAQATALTEKANAVSHMGAESSLAASEVYLPDAPGAALFVTAIAAKVSTDREVSARVAVDELHATTQRASLTGSAGIVEEGWQEHVDAAGKQIEATLTWRDTGAQTITKARLVIVADDENMVAFTGECVASSEAQLKPCEASLATLDPGIALDKRIALSLAPAGTQAPPRASAPSTMSDGSRTPMPPITLPSQARTTDRRPVYVGAGLVLLAAAFYWNQRRKKR